MQRNFQLIVDPGKGDCFRACVTSLLGIPNSHALPNVDDPEWFLQWLRLLRPLGLEIHYEQKACWRDGYWIASVKSKNFATQSHAIVMHGCDVFHDPTTTLLNRYETGTSLLSSDAVHGGHFLEVTDPSRLPKFGSRIKSLRKWIAQQ